MKRRLLLTLCALLCACSGGGGGGSAEVCVGNCSPPAAVSDALTVADVDRILSQGVGEAVARNQRATLAVVDRVGNVLGVYRMTGAATTFRISSGRGVTGGLEDVDILPDTFAALSKAITGAYLSSNGNAFSTRTAGQIIQENFNPGEANSPAGPLFGVQFSQLSCSDVMRRAADGSVGPQRSPLGLSADPGGLPLYKNNRLVGGVGVISDGVYGIDRVITDIDQDNDELIAVAATSGFGAPDDIRAERITADGRTFRFVDSESLRSTPSQAPALATQSGALVAVAGYNASSTLRAGTSFGNAASGIRALTNAESASLAQQNAFAIVDTANVNRFAPRAGTDALLSGSDATTVLAEALAIANRSRAQIRRPFNTQAQVTVTVIDSNGEIVALARTPDAPVFGIDVSAQKARGALLLSHPNTAADLSALPSANYLGAGGAAVPSFRSFAQYVATTRSFFNDANMLANGTAFSARAIGNIARPYFPDGLIGTGAGPLSAPIVSWSPFNVGMQLDLVYNAIVASATGSNAVGCTGLARAKNGIQIFPGAVPIYRGAQLIGAIGVSGDGVDQDDMIAFLGVANASAKLNNGLGNAPRERRADNLQPAGIGTRLRYVQCPQAPFIDSTAQNVCEGL
jgi:uncharacterized protein GlcG (DUF336 family)